jgi:hypothetical protein
MIAKRCATALSFAVILGSWYCAFAQVMPAAAPPIQQSQSAQSAPAYDNSDLLLSEPFTDVPAIPEPGSVQPPTLPARPPLDPPTLPGSGLPFASRGKPTLVWRAKVHRLFADRAPPVVRTAPGSLTAVFPNLLKACNEAGFEVKGESADSGELWVRRQYNDEFAVRCNLYFAVTEHPVGRVIVKVASDKNSGAELRAANSILDTFLRPESDRNTD